MAQRISTGGDIIDFDRVRSELGIPAGHPAAALAEAEAAAGRAPEETPPWCAGERTDARDIPFVTVDPAASRDLDQAVHIAEHGDGYRIRYAIADVTHFVEPEGALDAASRGRGLTYYGPDRSDPLYPEVLSHGAASLLPDADRPAVLWTIDVDAAGEPVAVDVTRVVVRSRAKFSYRAVQAGADVGDLHPAVALLPRVGRLREQAARRRHAINLDLPDAEVVPGADDHWTLRLRAMLPVEEYNAQVSLLTGMCAAQLMLHGRIGILRTLPDAGPEQVAALRGSARALGIAWPDGMPAGDLVSTMRAEVPREAALLQDALRLLRGAAYTPFEGTVPEAVGHAGLAAPYAHVTAPLRRLVDRFAAEVCLALSAGAPVPGWVTAALPELPGLMGTADRLARSFDRASTEAVTSFLVADWVGRVRTGIVLQRTGGADPEAGRATVLLDEPPVRVTGPARHLAEGERVAVRLVAAPDAAGGVEAVAVT